MVRFIKTFMSLKTLTPPVMKNSSVSLFTNKSFEISIITGVEKEGSATLIEACRGMCQLGFKINALPQGAKAWQDACFDLQSEFPDNFIALEAVPANRELALKNAQIVLFPAVPSMADLKLLQKKSIMVALPWNACETFTDMMNFDAQQESGNCFLYTQNHTWDLAANMVRAFENYKFSYDWGQLKKRWKDTKIS